MYNNNPDNMSNQNINLMTHFSPLRTTSRFMSAPRAVVLSLICLLAALLLPGMAHAQNPYAVIDGNVMTLYYGTDMDSHEGAFDVTEKFNGAEKWPEAVYQAKLQKVIFDASFAQYSPTSLYNLFGVYRQGDILKPGFAELNTIEGIENLNTQNVTDMSWMFFSCFELQGLDLSTFNTQNVTSMGSMFAYCIKLVTVTLGPDFTKLGKNAFSNCYSLSTINAKAITPEPTHNSAFDEDAYARVKLYVPEQSVEAYHNTPSWSRFRTINDVVQPHPYAVIRDSVMTLYYGTDMDSHEGAFDVTEKFNGAEKWPEAVHQANLQKVIFDESFAKYSPNSLYNLFGGFRQGDTFIPGFAEMNTIEGIENLNTQNVTDMSRMFENCSGLQSLDLSSFNIQNVTSMTAMFEGCSGLQSLDISSFNTQNVESMWNMFWDCSGLQSIDVSSFNTQNVKYMGGMFAGCHSLQSLDLSTFDTKNVKDMRGMFSGCSGLQSLDISTFNTQNVKYMDFMFEDYSMQSLDLSNFNTENVTSMEGIFSYCTNLASITLGPNFKKLDRNAFYNCTSLATINAMAIMPEEIPDNAFDADAYGSVKLYVPEQSFEAYLSTPTWNRFITINDVVQPHPYAVIQDHVMTLYYGTDMDSHAGAFDVTGKFYGAEHWPDAVYDADLEKAVFHESFADHRPTSLYNLFGYGKPFEYEGVSVVTAGFDRLQEIVGIEYLKTDYVTDISRMVAGCRSLQSIDVSTFNTQNVRNMSEMFRGCSSLQRLNLSNFNTEKVWAMAVMFEGCSNLQSLDLSSFNTQNMAWMVNIFEGCTKLATVTLGPDFRMLGKMAFNNCPALATINAKAITPEVTAEDAFDEAHFENVQLNVPIGSLEAYRNTASWSRFVNIKEVDFGHVVEIDPLEENQEVTFGNGDITPETNLSGTVVGNVYYNVETEDGGYDTASGSIVINKSTNDSQLSSVQDKELGSDAFKEAFTGLVVMVPAGKGTLKVTAESVGGMVLKVKIGNQPAAQLTLKGKMTGEFAYDVAEDTYIYIYGGDATAQARARRNVSVADKALKIYSVSWTKGVSDGIDTISTDGQPAVIYNLRGQRVKTMDKGVYIVNGKKVVKM